MKTYMSIFLFFGYLTYLASSYSFLTLGDWGCIDLHDSHAPNQIAVAKQLAVVAAARNSSFIINVGDNFYYIGVESVTDPQWNDDFENIYTEASVMTPWYSVLGNHDYGTNPECQTQYKSPHNNRWVLPSRTYTKRMQLSSNVYISWIFIDSSPCIAEYRSDDPSGWDPPADEAPLFHPNILAQNCTAQYNWFADTLSKVNKSDWLFVVGHHPADEMDVEDMTTLMQQANIDLYLCGHAHTLELFNIDNLPTPYVISGAGCMVAVPNVTEPLSKHELRAGVGAQNHTYKAIFNKKVAGFTAHTFSADFLSLKTDYLDYNGNLVYSFTISKK